MICEHRKLVKPAELVWIDDGWSKPGYEWTDPVYETTFVDLNLHQYGCSHCGQVFFYSDSARTRAEKNPGITNQWTIDWNNR